MNRMSPPTGVHARPVATPGAAVRSATSLKNFARPRYFATSGASTTTLASVWSVALATSRATARVMRVISRVSCLTPASRV